MEKKMVKVPFDLELAKKITNGEVEGRVVTRRGDNVRIVCWDYKSMSGDYQILALVDEGSQEEAIPYTKDGRYNVYGCFSESCLDLMLEIPEYMTFKEGDILTSGEDVFILKEIKGNQRVKYYFCTFMDYDIFDSDTIGVDLVKNLRFATEEKIEALKNRLKLSKKPKAKEYLKRFFRIEQKQEYEFKPFDKVLVRDEGGVWFADIFSHCTNNSEWEYKTAGGCSWAQCIPYNEQTAHMLGTTEDYKGD